MLLRHNDIYLTPEAISAACEWFADNALACAVAACSRSDSAVLQNAEFYVNDLGSYREDQQRFASEYLAGMYDHTFAVSHASTGGDFPGAELYVQALHVA